MHLLVVGGTGQCGLAFIPEALQAGHQLTLYARNPSKFPQSVLENPNVSVVKGEFTDIDTIKEALHKGAEVLVSFAGPAAPGKGMIITEFYERLYPLLNTESSVRRCMVLSTASYKAPEDKNTWKWWFGIWTIKIIGGSAYQEINGLSRLTASLPLGETEWTLFRVPGLTNGAAQLVRASTLGDGTDGLFLSRKSLAAWVLQELQERKHIGKAPHLSNPGWL